MDTAIRPVLFLDIDGVLVTARTLKLRSGRRAVADPLCVSELNRVTYSVDANLVLSSSWRFCGLEEMRLVLRHWGVDAPLISMTPDLTEKSGPEGLYSGVPRGREIQAWLDEHFGVHQFAIVDDDADMEHLSARLVRTQFQHGLTKSDADQLIKLLTSWPSRAIPSSE